MGLEKKVKGIYSISPSKEGNRLYLHYCNYFRHKGVLKPDKAKRCMNRHCNHYQRFYLRRR